MCDTEDFWTVWRVLLSAPSCCRVVPWIAVIKLQRLGHNFLRAAAIHTPEIFIHLMQLLSSHFHTTISNLSHPERASRISFSRCLSYLGHWISKISVITTY